MVFSEVSSSLASFPHVRAVSESAKIFIINFCLFVLFTLLFSFLIVV